MFPSMRVVVDLGDVDKSIEAMRTRARRLGPVFRRLRTALVLDQMEHASEHKGPEGERWAARKQSTLSGYKKKALRAQKKSRRKRKKKQPLGRLPYENSVISGTDFATVESHIDWSGIHNDGGVAGHGAVIPRRTFYWISDKLVSRAENALAKYVVGDP